MTKNYLSTKDIDPRERLIFALDVKSNDEAKALVEKLGDEVLFYKIGLELCMADDYFALLNWLIAQGKKVFADLKFFDVPQTVASAVRGVRDSGATFVTIHGNDAMMQAAAKEKGAAKILAVTALTSLDQGDLDDLGFKCDVKQLVLSRAKRACEAGCDGVVASGLEAKELRENIGDGFLIITPGIRPVLNDDDQKRTVDVKTAFLNGADYIVVGRPIRDAADPKIAAQAIQSQIAELFNA
jgi:orotidine-5'-phosphate decarboxylase